MTRPTVNLWRSRYAERGLAGLVEEQRPGRPRTVDRAKIIAATLTPPPNSLGSDALVEPAACPAARRRPCHGRGGVGRVRGQTVEGRHVQVLHRPRAGGEGPRRDRAVSESAGERDRALHRREVPGAGLEPDAEDAADAARTCRAAHPRLRPARHHHLVRRLGDRHRDGHRALQEPASSPGVPGLPQTSRPGLPRPRRRDRAAPGDGQLRRPQTHRDPRLAGREPAHPGPLHPDLRIVAEPGRGLVRHHRTPSHPPRQLPLRPRPDDQDPSLHHRLEPAQTPIHLDQTRRRDPRQDQPQT